MTQARKVAIVTAGGSHIGRAISLSLLQEGYQVFVTWLDSVDELASLGEAVTGIRCDAGVKADVDAFYA